MFGSHDRRSLRLLAVALLGTALACGGGSTGLDDEDGDDDPNAESPSALNFFEEDLVGLWRRFHAFDGSEEYWRFDPDRTACKWEEPSGSSARIEQRSYSHWSIDPNDGSLGSGRYRVVVAGSGLTSGLTFDYPYNELWPTSFTNLVFSPSGAAKTCP